MFGLSDVITYLLFTMRKPGSLTYAALLVGRMTKDNVYSPQIGGRTPALAVPF